MKKLKEDDDSSTNRTASNSHKRYPRLAHVYVLHALHDEREDRPHVVFQRVVGLHENDSLGGGLQTNDFAKLLR